MEFSFDEPALIAANLIELVLLAFGCIVLYRWCFGVKSPSLRLTRLLPWRITVSDFLTRALFAVLGGLSFQFLTIGLERQLKASLMGDLWLIVHNLAFQMGLIAGVLLGIAFAKTRHQEGPYEVPPASLAEEPKTPPSPFQMNPVWAGLQVFLGSLPLVALTSLLSGWVLRAAGIDTQQQELVDLLMRSDSLLLIAGMALLAVVLAPLIEEIVFRAGVFRYLRTRAPRVVSFLLSAVFFSALHNNLAAFVPLVVFGVVLAFVYERTGRLAICIFAHAFFNLHTLVILLTTLKD